MESGSSRRESTVYNFCVGYSSTLFVDHFFRMNGVTSGNNNAALLQVLQRSQNAVDAIEQHLYELRRKLQEKRNEIPFIEKELEDCKRICRQEEEQAQLEIEKRTPKNYVVIPYDTLVQVDSHFADSFYRSWKQSDKSFLTLSIPRPVEDTIRQFDEDISRRSGFSTAISEVGNHFLFSTSSHVIRMQFNHFVNF